MSILPTASPNALEPVWELATMYPYQGQWSEDAYLDLTEGANRLIEFSDGKLEFLAMPTEDHQDILLYLLDQLRAFVAAGDLGKVSFAGLRVRLRPGQVREPDIVFLCKQNFDKRGARVWDAADLAVEIVSDDDQSRQRDYDQKLRDYAAAGVSEYWIVDPRDKKISVFVLPEGSNAYVEYGVFTPGQAASSKLLAGLLVDVQAALDAGKV
ncbi:hypothetical protein Pla175_51030 [Pirellulimonas nuda]|uniref:Putative restriction endonuclease domain-containing protein n=1 Tax=Pirellulimonas nuda TaxID=2528009 RepID=A0A518DJM3_9BACT|nr:Uma2 family endonuclease [Pirellulimonas nuda]QDU91673.1 hypothetical protein Pla175_51030 [Pirellulimonas nuda]